MPSSFWRVGNQHCDPQEATFTTTVAQIKEAEGQEADCSGSLFINSEPSRFDFACGLCNLGQATLLL